MTILILAGAAVFGPINFLPSTYAQYDSNYGSGGADDFADDLDGASSDGSTDDDELLDYSQDSLDQSLDGSSDNEVIDDPYQDTVDETPIDDGVDDSQDNTDASTDNFQTAGAQNSDPTADAGSDFEVDENSNVVLDGSASVDQEGDISSYSWEQIDGYQTAELNGADSVQPSFTAPDVDSNQELTFQLSVSDNDGLTDTDSVNVLVKDISPPDVPANNVQSSVPDEQNTEPNPQVNKDLEVPDVNTTNCVDNETDCPGLEPDTVGPEQPVIDPCLTNETEIDCNTPGPEPSIIDPCFGNETGVDCNTPGPEPSIIDPCFGNETEIDCNTPGQGPPVTSATPGCPDDMVGNMTQDDCVFPSPTPGCPDDMVGNITDSITGCIPPEPCPENENFSRCLNRNEPPVADAGGDQVVDEEMTVTLNGHNSYDTDGNISYSWIQTDGEPLVTLVDSNSPSPSFIAPLVDGNSTITLELTVTDNNADNGVDYVNIFVTNVNTIIISPPEGTISLDEIPKQIDAGSIFVFSGRLDIKGISDYQQAYVQIKVFNNGSEDILSFGTADIDGRYVTEWTAAPRESPYEVYARYDDGYGHTLNSDIQTFQVRESHLQLENQSIPVVSGPYIPIEFNNYKKSTINVYVVANDDASRPYVSTAVKAIEYWSQVLKERSGNNGAWEFKYFTFAGSLDVSKIVSKIGLYPINILVNLKNAEIKDCKRNMGGQGQTTAGIAHTLFLQRLFKSTIQIHVYTGCGGTNWNTLESEQVKEVKRITFHEFGHALGLGHMWKENDDLMCSTDYLRRNFLERLLYIIQIPLLRQVDTCYGAPDKYHDDKYLPSEFDINAMIYSYGHDGFAPPNRRISVDTVFKCEFELKLCETSFKHFNVKKPEIPKVTEIPPVTKVTNPPEPPTKDEEQIHKKTITSSSTTNSKTLTTEPAQEVIHIKPSQAQSVVLVNTWGSLGKGEGQFNHPASLSTDSNGQRIYVADLDNNRIEVLHSNGHYITSWGTAGKGPGQFQGPGSIALDEEKKIIFVADIKNNRIQKFDIQGNFIKEWGRLGSADGQFDHPGDITLDSDKEILYVTDIYNNRIQAFYYDGSFITKWGSFGTGNGQFNRPAGITINHKEDTVYISDTANNRIQEFDSDGNFIRKWGSLGIANGNFARPDGIRFEPSQESIYVADRQNHRIQVFDSEGRFVTKWTTSNVETGPIKPRDVDLDSSGQIYVVNKANSNVLIYKFSSISPSTELKVEKQNTKAITTSSREQQTQERNDKPHGEISLGIEIAKSSVTRGNVQTITVKVTDSVSKKAINNAQVQGSIDYVSSHVESFSGDTDSSGKVTHSWRISGNASPGEFGVNVDVHASGYDDASETDSFEVLPKA